MQVPKSVVTVLLAGVLAACSGTPAVTTAPGGATQNPGGGLATPGADATQGGGGGGTKPAGWDAKGKVHYDLSGPATKSGDIGFFPTTSIFGGLNQTILYFVTEGVQETFIITISNGGEITVAYASLDMSAPGAVCTSSNLKVEASSASGSIDCTNVSVIPKSGAMMTGGRLQATFDAHN